MTVVEALIKNRDCKIINIKELAKELNISDSTLYRYMKGTRKLKGLDAVGLAFYLYLKYNIETEELEEYKVLFKNK